jgi:hypothetical protein
MDGADNSTTFTDSSACRNGNMTAVGGAKLSTAQSKFGGASLVLNGTSDYAQIPLGTSASCAFGTGDFTIEGWIYITSLAAQNTIFDSRPNSTNGSQIMFSVKTTGVLTLFASNAERINSSAGAITTNTWIHVALCRSNGTTRMFINGTQAGSSFADTISYTVGTVRNARIGASGFFAGGGEYFAGYIDEFRITRAARYVASFTPATAAFPETDSGGANTDPFWGSVALLLHADGSNGSTTFTDSSPYARAITNVGSTTISTTQAKFGGASGFFSGSSHLTVPVDSIVLGTNSFTIEFWLYQTVAGDQNVFDQRQASFSQAAPTIYTTANGSVHYYVSGSARIMSAAGVIPLNTWCHIAVARAVNQTRLFVNGVQVGATWTDTTTYINSRLSIGTYGVNPSGYFNGFLDELRVTNGVCRYNTSSFTPPSAASIEVGPRGAGEDPWYANTSLLLHMDGAAFVDNSFSPKAVTAVGNAAISAAQSRFGGGSGLFDGTGDYYSTPANADAFGFGTGSFTVEGWVYISAFNSASARLCSTASTFSNFSFEVQSNGSLAFWNGSSLTTFGSAGTIVTGQWYHVAFTRDGSSVRAFVNGSQVGTTATISTNMTNTLTVQSPASANAASCACYLDEIRVTKGVARYRSTFSPSTSAFPNP